MVRLLLCLGMGEMTVQTLHRLSDDILDSAMETSGRCAVDEVTDDVSGLYVHNVSRTLFRVVTVFHELAFIFCCHCVRLAFGLGEGHGYFRTVPDSDAELQPVPHTKRRGSS
jgi:hypothetical protein